MVRYLEAQQFAVVRVVGLSCSVMLLFTLSLCRNLFDALHSFTELIPILLFLSHCRKLFGALLSFIHLLPILPLFSCRKLFCILLLYAQLFPILPRVSCPKLFGIVLLYRESPNVLPPFLLVFSHLTRLAHHPFCQCLPSLVAISGSGSTYLPYFVERSHPNSFQLFAKMSRPWNFDDVYPKRCHQPPLRAHQIMRYFLVCMTFFPIGVFYGMH